MSTFRFLVAWLVCVALNAATIVVRGPVLAPGAGAPASYEDLILAQSPEHYYRFGEASGDAIDETTNADGVVTGTVTREVAGAIDGDADTAYSFPGDGGDYVAVASATDPTAMTISAWVKWDGSLDRSIICRTDASGTGSARSHQLRVDITGHPSVDLYDEGAATNKTVTSADAIAADTWTHIVGKGTNGGTLKLYVNGVSKGTPVALVTMWTGGDRWRIAEETSGSFGAWSGPIDELAIFLSELSEAQIVEQYELGAGL